MRLNVITLLSLVLICLGCSDSDEPLQGWKESDVEVVNEGAAAGTTGQVVISGDAAPMTATSLDTTTDLDMITDEQIGLVGSMPGDEPDGEPRQRSLAEQFDTPPTEAQRDSRDPARGPTAGQRPARATDPAPAPRPTTTRQSRPRPSEPREDEQPRPAERPEAEPADPNQDEEDLPPVVVIPPREPEPPSDESREAPPPSNDTARSDTSPEPDREDPPDDEKPGEGIE